MEGRLPKRLLTVSLVTRILLITWFIVANIVHLSIGLADNSDFYRSIQMFSSGPAGTVTGEPTMGSPDFARRYNAYWLPYWTVDFHLTSPNTSAIFMWAPGIVLNLILFSRDTLSVPLLSVIPRGTLFVLLLLLFNWVDRRLPHPAGFLIGIGVPVTLMLTTTDILVFQNSFYQEGPALLYLLLTLAFLMALRIRPSWRNLTGTMAALFLLATSKSAYMYWPFLVIPSVFVIWKSRDRLQARVGLVVTLFVSMVIVANGTDVRNRNTCHSLLYGALPFSADPASHLERLGLEGLTEHVDDRGYASVGSIRFAHTVNVIVHEPRVLFRMAVFAAGRMQDESLDYLGKYAFEDPRSVTDPPVSRGVEERFQAPGPFNPFNAWSALKYAVFPTGVALLGILLCFIVWFLMCAGLLPLLPEIPLVGLLATLGCGVDLLIAILGDGKFELIKHLFLANILFDLASIAFFASIALCGLRIRDRMRVIPSPHQALRGSF